MKGERRPGEQVPVRCPWPAVVSGGLRWKIHILVHEKRSKPFTIENLLSLIVLTDAWRDIPNFLYRWKENYYFEPPFLPPPQLHLLAEFMGPSMQMYGGKIKV